MGGGGGGQVALALLPPASPSLSPESDLKSDLSLSFVDQFLSRGCSWPLDNVFNRLLSIERHHQRWSCVDWARRIGTGVFIALVEFQPYIFPSDAVPRFKLVLIRTGWAFSQGSSSGIIVRATTVVKWSCRKQDRLLSCELSFNPPATHTHTHTHTHLPLLSPPPPPHSSSSFSLSFFSSSSPLYNCHGCFGVKSLLSFHSSNS